MSLVLRASHIAKQYGRTPVLNNISMSFEEKGIYVLMGDNGSGKSTFLRICALLEDPDGGSANYEVNGTLLPRDINLRRRISLVLPGVGAFNTSVHQNVLYGLKLRGIKGNDASRKAVRAIDFVGLDHKKEQNALTLSSGETQRLGLARALAIEPEVLFLDEPAAFVDARNREIIEEIIRNLAGDSRRTVIMTTHNRRQAQRLSNRLFFLENGNLRPA